MVVEENLDVDQWNGIGCCVNIYNYTLVYPFIKMAARFTRLFIYLVLFSIIERV